MNQTQNSPNNFSNNSNFFNNQNSNNYQPKNNLHTTQQTFSNSSPQGLNVHKNNINRSNPKKSVIIKSQYYNNQRLKDKINKVKAHPLMKKQIAKLFQIINLKLKKQVISSYFLNRSLVPSRDTQQVLLQKYSLFYQSQKRMCLSFIRQYLPYISSQFRSEFNKNETIGSFLVCTQWTMAIGFFIYKSRIMNYKWRNLTISPRFGWKSLFFLFLFNIGVTKTNSGLFKSLIKKNISEFDSIVKTQDQILLIKKRMQNKKN